MHVGYHHYHKKKKLKKLDTFIDKMVYIVGSIGVMIFIPQLLLVWSNSNISGVSLFSWAGMFVASMFWFLYGFVHKAKPIMFINVLAASVQVLIIVGIFIHR